MVKDSVTSAKNNDPESEYEWEKFLATTKNGVFPPSGRITPKQSHLPVIGRSSRNM